MRLKKSVRLQFFLILAGVSIVPLLAFSLYSFQSNQAFYNNQVVQASKTEIRRITTTINNHYSGVQNLLQSLLFSTYDQTNCMTSICEQEAIGEKVSQSARLKNYRMFKYVCSNTLANSDHVDGVYLICENKHVYSYAPNYNYGLERTYEDSDWYDKLINSGSSLEIAEMAEMYTNQDEPEKNNFLVARKFWSVKGKHTAVLAVVCKDSIFGDITGENNLPWGNMMIMDGDRNVLFGEETEESTEPLYSITDVEKGSLNKKNIHSARIYDELDINDWIVVSNVTFEGIYESYIRNVKILAVFLGVIILVIVLGLYYIDRIHVRPVVRLAKIMGIATQQKFLFHNEYEGREDEIGLLYDYFDKMMKQIDRLIQEKYEIEIKTLKSRLRNLTSQINAHFIFNTLENISCFAQIEGNKQIAVMSKSLGDMLRYSMDFEREFVRLPEEIANIRQYLNIQEIRFGNKIDLDVCLEKGTEQRKVIKFILQPIIENATEHGMSEEKLPWKIQISTHQEDNNLLIRIKDTGMGMDEETLEKVRKRIYEPEQVEEEKRGYNIGLVNIHQRIQLLFSEAYGLTIESKLQEGTIVTIKIPGM